MYKRACDPIGSIGPFSEMNIHSELSTSPYPQSNDVSFHAEPGTVQLVVITVRWTDDSKYL